MDLILTIIEKAETIGTQETKRVFSEAGGTLGRSAKSAWQFADPQRVISNTHAKIDYVGGQYLLVDESTNGVRLNGATKPLGKGNHAILSAGDTFQLGGIKLQATFDFGEDSIIDSAFSALLPSDDTSMFSQAEKKPSAPAPIPAPVSPPLNPPALQPNAHSLPMIDDYFGANAGMHSQPGQEASQIMDPLVALGGGNEFPANIGLSNRNVPVGNAPFASNGSLNSMGNDPLNDAMPFTAPVTTEAHSEDLNAFAETPAIKETSDGLEIPENWDISQISSIISPQKPDTEKLTPTPIPASVPASANVAEAILEENTNPGLEKIKAPAKNPENSAESYTPSSHSHANSPENQALLSALGLDANTIPADVQAQVVPLAAELVRETLAGLINEQEQRRALKQTHRLNQTTIAPAENNPLKFSASVPDALQALFARPSNHYITGPKAVKALFMESALHEQALTQAHNAAHQAVMAHLNPHHITSEQAKQDSGFRFKSKTASQLEELQARWADTARQQEIYDAVFREKYEQLVENRRQLNPHHNRI